MICAAAAAWCRYGCRWYALLLLLLLPLPPGCRSCSPLLV